MTSLEILEKIEQYIKCEQQSIRETDENNMYNINVGMRSALSRMIYLVHDMRSDEIQELESIIDGE